PMCVGVSSPRGGSSAGTCCSAPAGGKFVPLAARIGADGTLIPDLTINVPLAGGGDARGTLIAHGYPRKRMPFPQTRLRRLRATRALRGLVRETNLAASDFVYPMFVAHGVDRREPIEAMP